MSAIGQPLSRVDGRLKVTGAARYAADIPITDLAHGAIVHSTVANGRTAAIDTSDAERAPGVFAVFTHRNMPRMNPTPKPWSHLHPHGQSYLPLQDGEIHYAGQPVALILAATRDQAEHAGTLVHIGYQVRPPLIFGPDSTKDAFDPPQFLWPVSSAVGNADAGIAAGDVKLERTYSTADRHHNQIEPHVTAAVWDSTGTLTLYMPTQYIFGERELISIVLGVAPEKITVVSHFVGGGYGGKAYVWPHTLLAAVAARTLSRGVSVQLTRAQMYSMVGHQPATIQTVSLGARKDGRLTGLRHESTTPTSMFDNYIEYAANCSRSLWAASGGIATSHRIVHTNRGTPTPMRPPHEALGHFALESAMDELAYACGVDPVQLRLLNDTDVDPYSGRPFSSRALRTPVLVACPAEVPDGRSGALRLGEAPPGTALHARRPVSMGQGVASAIYTHWRWPAKARVTVSRDGTALVEAGTQEIGTGTYTVMQQVAADTLGLPFEKVSVRIGDTRLPYSHGSIGSATMANAGSSIMLAAKAARDKAVAMAISGVDAPFAGASAREVLVGGGTLSLAGRNVSMTYPDLLRRNGLSTLVGDGDYDPIDEDKGPKAIFSFSAVFAEVRVDPDLGLIRLNRFVGAYDAGRIINPKTARSQAIGGIAWGVGQALLEQSDTHPVLGRFVNRNLSGYLVASNADIPQLEIFFVGDFDDEASLIGAKGMGELTAVSVAPAIANAVYHATGKRVRELPIKLERLL